LTRSCESVVSTRKNKGGAECGPSPTDRNNRRGKLYGEAARRDAVRKNVSEVRRKETAQQGEGGARV
jgi:hypothetical protein